MADPKKIMIHGVYPDPIRRQIIASKMTARTWPRMTTDRKAEIWATVDHRAKPHLFGLKSPVPPEFKDWEKARVVDIRGENWPDKDVFYMVVSTISGYSAVAVPKGGKWFALTFPDNQTMPALLTPISEADALEMVQFPSNWERHISPAQSAPRVL